MYNCSFKVTDGGGAGTESDMLSPHVMTEAIIQSAGIQKYSFKGSCSEFLRYIIHKALVLVTGTRKLFEILQ